MAKPVAVYSYCDNEGNLLFEVHRSKDKKFYMCRPDPNDPTKRIKGTANILPVLYRLPEIHKADPTIPVFVAEGEKDADTLAKNGFLATTNRGGPGKWKDCYNDSLKDRDVMIVPDNDRDGREHAQDVAKSLDGVARSVRILSLPGLPESGDVTDWFEKGTAEQLRALADAAPLSFPSSIRSCSPTEIEGESYIEKEGCLVHLRRINDDDVIPETLTNFTARIISDITISDGIRTDRRYAIEANVQGELSRFDIPATQFASLNWIPEKLGAKAILYPGPSREHTRAAIQIKSGDVPKRQMYAHIGWTKIEGVWYYLHADGAIGPVGPLGPDDGAMGPKVSSADLVLPEPLKRYRLPKPPSGDVLRDALRSSLLIIKVADPSITIPVLSSVYVPVLCKVDYSIFETGPTGAGKSELAALAQQHYGPEMDARNLPMQWSSTANSMEALAFYAKDAVMVVDDFVLIGSSSDVAKRHAEADRLLRASGNQGGRHRMTSEGNLQAAKFPRCLLINTGEDVPVGHSLRARTLILEIGPEDLDFSVLSILQKHAREGTFALALAGFIAHVASDYEGIRARFNERALQLRPVFIEKHRRTAPLVATLAVAFEEFLDFAFRQRTITETERDAIWQQTVDALKRAGKEQGKYHDSNEPTQKFLTLLRAAITSGKAHVTNLNGYEPGNARMYGWVLTERGEAASWRPFGAQVGWVDRDDLYLDPEASYKSAQEMGGNGPEALTVTRGVLHKGLRDKGLLKTTEEERGHLTIRKSLQGARRAVLHLALGTLFDVVQTDQPAQSPIEPSSDAPLLPPASDTA